MKSTTLVRPEFPLKKGEKVPLNPNYKAQATSDAKLLIGWAEEGYNLGYVPSMGGETVIDLDVHKGKNGKAELEKLAASLGQTIPQTTTVRTPSGGLHLYFKGLAPYDKINFLPGVDIMCHKRYVVAAGSKTPEGRYTLIMEDGSPFDVADLPQWFIDEMLRRKGASKKSESKPLNITIDADTPEKIAAAIEIIHDWPEAVEGERNVQLFQLACELCKAGVSEKKAIELYFEHGIERLHYGMDDRERDEAGKTIHSAYEEKQGEFGSSSDQAVASVFGPAKYDVEDWTTIAEMSVPERKWIIKDWLLSEPGTVVLFSGQGGTGKSLLGLLLAYCLATGEEWLGLPVERRAKSMIVSCEDSMQEQARRIQRIEASYKRPMEKGIVKLWCRTGANNILAYTDKHGYVVGADFLKELKEKCAAHFGKDGGIVIFDTLSDFVALNENDRTMVSQFVKHILAGFAIDLGVTVILLAHPNKTNSGFSGSSAWEGAARSRWELAWKKEKANADVMPNGALTLTLAKSNTTMAGKRILLRYGEDHLPHVTEEAKEDTTVRDRMLELIRKAEEDGRPYGPAAKSPKSILKAEIMDSFDQPADEKELRHALEYLLSHDLVEVIERKRNKVLVPIGTEHK